MYYIIKVIIICFSLHLSQCPILSRSLINNCLMKECYDYSNLHVLKISKKSQNNIFDTLFK